MKPPGPKPRPNLKSAKTGTSDPAAGSKRAIRALERRKAIAAAALEEFTARGYAATRLDDVAARAGVAKGTIYLHFKDKEALFQELVRTVLVPVIPRFIGPPPAGISARAMVEGFAEMFVRDVARTKRGDILRLIMAEGVRFPSLAEFYYHEVVERGLVAMRQMIDYGIARGEIRSEGLSRFPQIVVAPAMMAIVWQGLFAPYAPLDTLAMLRAYIDLIFGPRSSE